MPFANHLYKMLELFAEEDHGKIKLYDFGDGQTVMPMPDLLTGSYLASSICVLVVGNVKHDDWKPEMCDGKIHAVPGGHIIAVEFSNDTEPGQLLDKLNAGVAKLLEVADGQTIPVDKQ